MGSLALNEAEPVLYTWRWYYTGTGIGLWIVLILTMILPKANRTPKTLLILVPLAVVSLGWFIVRRKMGGNLPDNVVFGIMIHTLAVGSAALWLLGHRLAAGAWYKTLPAAAGVALGIAILGGLSLGVESDEMLAATAFVGVMMAATVAGYALAAWGYRARRAWRFLALQAAGTLVVSFAGVFVGMLVLLAILDDGPAGAGEFVAGIVGAGLVAGLMAFLIALPFAILGLSCPFFRQRLLMCLPQQAGASPG